jgi:uncharacterized protein (TIGR03435 family)
VFGSCCATDSLAFPLGNRHPSDERAGGPSFFDALKDQLGLKLKPTKAQFQVLVIDHVELPTPN